MSRTLDKWSFTRKNSDQGSRMSSKTKQWNRKRKKKNTRQTERKRKNKIKKVEKEKVNKFQSRSQDLSSSHSLEREKRAQRWRTPRKSQVEGRAKNNFMSNQSDTILLDLNYLPSGHGVADLGRKYIFYVPSHQKTYFLWRSWLKLDRNRKSIPITLRFLTFNFVKKESQRTKNRIWEYIFTSFISLPITITITITIISLTIQLTCNCHVFTKQRTSSQHTGWYFIRWLHVPRERYRNAVIEWRDVVPPKRWHV